MILLCIRGYRMVVIDVFYILENAFFLWILVLAILDWYLFIFFFLKGYYNKGKTFLGKRNGRGVNMTREKMNFKLVLFLLFYKLYMKHYPFKIQKFYFSVKALSIRRNFCSCYIRVRGCSFRGFGKRIRDQIYFAFWS